MPTALEDDRSRRASPHEGPSTRVLIGCGIFGPALFVTVLLVEGAMRPGYDPTYHVGSALSLGQRGGIQIANFILTGALLMGYAVGVHQRLQSRAAALLIGIVGLALVIAGCFTMDPMRGYPPGTPTGTPTHLTWHHQVHDSAGPVIFLAIPASCVVVARRLRGAWRLYSFATMATGLALLVWFVTAWNRDAANAGLLQRAMIVVDFSWLAVVAAHLLRRDPGVRTD